ncbi:hypothetical protein LTR92_011185 [Exophiala xenobiotica]|nr:hypothetical protein LTR92_011185 [Exophiala xenobiotica]
MTTPASKKRKTLHDYSDQRSRIPTVQNPEFPPVELPIPGLALILDFITADEDAAFLTFLETQKWRTDLRRRCIHYGGTFVLCLPAMCPLRSVNGLRAPSSRQTQCPPNSMRLSLVTMTSSWERTIVSLRSVRLVNRYFPFYTTIVLSESSVSPLEDEKEDRQILNLPAVHQQQTEPVWSIG